MCKRIENDWEEEQHDIKIAQITYQQIFGDTEFDERIYN